ncbi:unnamed protein product, partial [Brassica rapa]
MTCMQVDLKSFIYVTIHLQRSPSWLNKPSILPYGSGRNHPLGFRNSLWKTPSLLQSLCPKNGRTGDMFGDDNRFIAKHVYQIKGCLLSH